jgi:hypothetical protein
VVLEVLPVDDGPGRLALGAFPDGSRYRKHVLDLDGLGVRDLCPDGDDLLVLAGPSMALSGPVRVYRWHGAAVTDTGRIVRGRELTRELDLLHGEGVDHAEGIALLDPGRGRSGCSWSTTARPPPGGRASTRSSPTRSRSYRSSRGTARPSHSE